VRSSKLSSPTLGILVVELRGWRESIMQIKGRLADATLVTPYEWEIRFQKSLLSVPRSLVIEIDLAAANR